MTWTCTWLYIYFSMFMQLPVFQVHLIDKKFVQPQLNCNCKTICRVRKDTVSMGAGLPFGMNARTCVLNHIGGSAQPPIRLDREYGDTSARVIGDQSKAARLLDTHVAGVTSV